MAVQIFRSALPCPGSVLPILLWSCVSKERPNWFLFVFIYMPWDRQFGWEFKNNNYLKVNTIKLFCTFSPYWTLKFHVEYFKPAIQMWSPRWLAVFAHNLAEWEVKICSSHWVRPNIDSCKAEHCAWKRLCQLREAVTKMYVRWVDGKFSTLAWALRWQCWTMLCSAITFGTLTACLLVFRHEHATHSTYFSKMYLVRGLTQISFGGPHALKQQADFWM